MGTKPFIFHKDSVGNIIKEGDVIMIVTRSSRFFLKARFNKTQKEWFFYTHEVVGFSWEDLLLPQVVHIEIIPQCGQTV